MNLTLDSALLEKMTDGVISLDANGQLVDYNHAAWPWIKHYQARASELGEVIRQIAAGTAQAPVNVGWMHPEGKAEAEFHVCKSGSQGFAIFISKRAATTAVASQAPQQDSFFSLLGEGIRHEFSDLRRQLDTAQPHSPVETDQLQKQSMRLSRLLVAMDQLCELQQPDPFSMGERVSVQDIITKVIAALQVRRNDYSINDSMSGDAQAQGMVFGHAAWLQVAIQGLLEGIGDCAPADCQIEIRVRQNGGFVVMTGNASRFFKVSKPLAKAHPATSSALTTDTDLRLAICRRIIELHHGQLKIVFQDNEQSDGDSRGIESFTLIMPTGAPMRRPGQGDCAGCLFPKQAEMYAQDLAFLMPSSPIGSTLSDEELVLLSHITTRRAPAQKQQHVVR